MVLDTQFSVYTLDGAFALIGGYAALIWQFLSIMLSWYQDFSYSNALA